MCNVTFLCIIWHQCDVSTCPCNRFLYYIVIIRERFILFLFFACKRENNTIKFNLFFILTIYFKQSDCTYKLLKHTHTHTHTHMPIKLITWTDLLSVIICPTLTFPVLWPDPWVVIKHTGCESWVPGTQSSYRAIAVFCFFFSSGTMSISWLSKANT